MEYVRLKLFLVLFVIILASSFAIVNAIPYLPLSAPANFKATVAPGTTNITATWDAVEGADGYKIYYWGLGMSHYSGLKFIRKDFPEIADVGNVTSVSSNEIWDAWTNLSGYVVAYNSEVGESFPSNEVNVMIKLPAPQYVLYQTFREGNITNITFIWEKIQC